MADSFTSRGLVLQVTGSNTGTWGSDLNTNAITITDQLLGTTLSYSISTGTSNLTQAQSQNLAFLLTGTLTGNVTVTLPLNLATSLTTAVGGIFIFNNQTTGNFTVTVQTVASGSTGVTISQGVRAILYSDTVNVTFANDGGPSAAFKIRSVAGNPNGTVAGTAGSATTLADVLSDRTNNEIWFCTTTGSSSTAVWSPAVPSITAVPPPTSGYLTLSNDTTNPIASGDLVGQSTIYYTPFIGNLIGIPNGTTFTIYTFAQLSCSLVSQAANNIFDAFVFLNSGSAALGLGPSWTAGGGSVTAGSCARGIGGGSSQLTRIAGVYVNAVTIQLNNGGTTYSVAPGCAIYVGSVFIDGTVGQISCYRSWGQSRKWGIWNYYNRQPVVMQAGDGTSSWDYNSATPRFSNGSALNKVTAFVGVAEETIQAQFNQQILLINSLSPPSTALVGIALNSPSSPISGAPATSGTIGSQVTQGNVISLYASQYLPNGINVYNQWESGITTGFCRFYGGIGANALYLNYRG